MEFDTGMFLEPALVLLVRVEIVQNDVKLAAREGGHDFVHEAEKLDTPALLGMLPENFPGSDFKSGEQCRRAVPLVIVALTGQRPPIGQLQIALCPFQRLDRRLFVDA